MKLAIVGSRGFNDYSLLQNTIKSLSIDISTIISGGAKGADSLAKQYAIENELELIEFIPDWNKYGLKAGMLRNTDIINEADCVIAFWDSKSIGTKDSIIKAKKSNKLLKVLEYNKTSLF